MRRFFLLTAPAIAASALVAGCAAPPWRSAPPPVTGSAIGAVLGAPSGYVVEQDVIGTRRERARRVVRAGGRALAPAAVHQYMSRHEGDLRQETAGTGVQLTRQGNVLLARLSSGFTFDTGSATLKPQSYAPLTEIARSLRAYPSTMVDVLGHTDSTGTAASNLRLSERRAQAVAAFLSARGVARARIATRGHGSTMPIASNDTEEGRAINRRVEIKVVPVTQPDVR